MDLSKMTKEEIELLSYTDLTNILLEEKPMKTAEVFKKICDLLDYSEDDFSSKIGEYYTSLTIDKRFVLLDNAEWDLSKHHVIKIDHDDDDELEEVEKTEEEPVENEEIDIEEPIEDEEIVDDDDDDLEELSVIGEEELEEN